MECLGVNILNSEEFCSDLIALFFNHIWECPECLDKVGDYILSIFVLVGSTSFILFLVFIYIFFLIQRTAYRYSYKKKYEDLCSDYADLSDKFNELAYEHTVLLDQHKDLQKEYYHTCN